MQCPNCGREVRSKSQCAYCGHVFSEQEVNESQELSREVVPRTKKNRNVGGFVWNLVKILLAVAVLFLLIMYGPDLASSLWNQFGFGNDNQTNVVENISQESESEVTTSEQAESEVAVTTESDAVSDSQTSEEEASSEEAVAGISIENSEVNVDDYPIINVVLDFNESLGDLTTDSFAFSVGSNGSSTPIEDFSLLHNGQTLTVSYNDPSLQVVAVEDQEQILHITSESLGIDEEVTINIPDTNIDEEQFDQFNDSINTHLSGLGQVSAVFNDVTSDVPLVYDNQSVEASNLISWFVLQSTYQAIEDGDFTLESSITILDDLKADNQDSTVSQAEDGSQMLVSELILAVVQNQDVSALNHLIQATGGPNNLNMWAAEEGYFSTKINELLNVNADGTIVGSFTSAQDIALLLTQLANDELVSAEMDAQFKEVLLQTPVTEKYPVGNELVNRRFELATSDTDEMNQYYSGILETEDAAYVVVSLLSSFSDTEEAVAATSDTIMELITYFETGDTEAASQEEESVVSSDEADQVSIIDETADEEVTPPTQATESTPTTPTTGAGSGEYYIQYVENTNENIYLPDRSIVNANGQIVEPTWWYDESTATYRYSFD
ncbi:serine hydrolase [Fundicoccus culcitae]|uniref:Serine hydrolase n=1 Tax=Fundicoccus culcitae TaxID=2969821 RepID=A0ABY5P4Y8_9LACT|nr:serine hydrolase [Fundicoccus culcitae]UUX33819.1 serine hydrolase [Fundicoccus culcitae]